MSDGVDQLITFTERLLTWRKRRRETKRYKQQQKNVILDWLEAFVWAAFVVLLINQYLLQAYQIPSGSMIRTLLIGDRIFVNKLVYGPELIPGYGKLEGFDTPERNDVLIFENPSYIGKGPIFDIAQRVIYMLTLSLVDIDRDEFGQPRDHFLIKRAVGDGGDRFRISGGNMSIRPRGERAWIPEEEFKALSGGEYRTIRAISEADYDTIRAAGAALARRDLDLPAEPEDQSYINAAQSMHYIDPFELEHVRQRLYYSVEPDNPQSRSRLQFIRAGWYVPEDHVFPMGDNRDNSRDGRYFGAVADRRVLGRAMFIYWPLQRFGSIQ